MKQPRNTSCGHQQPHLSLKLTLFWVAGWISRWLQEVPFNLSNPMVQWKYSSTPSLFPIHRFPWKATGTGTKAVVIYSAPMLGAPTAVRCVVRWCCPIIRKQALYRVSEVTPCQKWTRKVQVLCKAWRRGSISGTGLEPSWWLMLHKWVWCSLHCSFFPDLGLVCFPVQVSIQFRHKELKLCEQATVTWTARLLEKDSFPYCWMVHPVPWEMGTWSMKGSLCVKKYKV